MEEGCHMAAGDHQWAGNENKAQDSGGSMGRVGCMGSSLQLFRAPLDHPFPMVIEGD